LSAAAAAARKRKKKSQTQKERQEKLPIGNGHDEMEAAFEWLVNWLPIQLGSFLK